MIETGMVCLNGDTVREKRKKVRPGDVVNIDDQVELIIVTE